MENQELLPELESIASQLGIKLRYEKGDFEGGYCVLKSERIIVINKKLSPSHAALRPRARYQRDRFE